MAEHDDHRPGPAEPYTVHDDADRIDRVGDEDGHGRATAEAPARRSGPDPVALLAGLAALLVAVLALTDTLDAVDPRWAVAVVAIGLGGGVLLATLRRRRS